MAMKKRLFALAAVGALALVLASPGTSSAIIIIGPGGVNYGGFGWGGLGWGGLGLGGLGYAGYGGLGGYGYPGFFGGGYRMPMVGYGGASYAPGYGMSYGYGGLGASTSPYSYVGYGTTYTPYRFAYSPGYRGIGYAGYGVTVPSSYAMPANTSVAWYPPLFTRSSGTAGVGTGGTSGAARPASYGGGGGADTRAIVQVEVPANATLWFDGEKTQQTGGLRTFHTPPLERGHSYHYDVKARWEQNGKTVERTRRVDVYAGGRVTVDFNEPGK
jgi:uncharacterized protein (TIGR03000 family)